MNSKGGGGVGGGETCEKSSRETAGVGKRTERVAIRNER